MTRVDSTEMVTADLAPDRGTFIIHENQTSYSLQLLIMADEVETCVLKLDLGKFTRVAICHTCYILQHGI